MAQHKEYFPKKSHQYQCTDCDQKFAAKNNLEKHIKSNHEQTIYIPKREIEIDPLLNCSNDIENVIEIKQEVISEEQNVDDKVCHIEIMVEPSDCMSDRDINTDEKQSDINLHHTETGDRICKEEIETDDQPFNSSNIEGDNTKIDIGLFQLVNVEYDKYSCKICHKKLANNFHMKTHMRVHTGEKPFRCSMCNKNFTEAGSLKKHTKRVHTVEKAYSCEICEKKFAISFDLKVHKRNHTGDKPYICDMCDKKFAQSGHLKQHMRFHTGERPHCCNMCDKKFAMVSDLKVHMRNHTGEKPYKCDNCEIYFTKSSSFQQHMRVHTRETPHTCEICHKKFANAGHLKVHLRIHTGEKPYSCNVCDKKFSEASSLKKHLMRIHKLNETYTCDICHKKFVQSSDLEVHKQIHTADKQYVYVKCEPTSP